MTCSAVIGGAMLVCAAVVWTAAFAALGFDYGNLAVLGENIAVHEVELNISDTLHFTGDNFAIDVVRSEDETGKLVYKDFKEFPKELQITDGAVRLEQKPDITVMGASVAVQWKYGLLAGVLTEDLVRVKLYLPASFSGELNIEISNGSISVSDMVCSDLVATTKNGTVTIENVTADKVTSETYNGTVNLKDVTCAKVRGTSRNGSVCVDRIQADEIVLNVNSGSVSGTVSGRETDYAIETECDFGSCNLTDRREGDKRLEVHVGLGSITLSFLG